MGRWLKILGGVLAVGIVCAVAAVTIGGPDLIYPYVPGESFGPSSIAFEDTDPGKTIGGTIVQWGLEVGQPGVADDAGHGDHGGSCKGFRDTNHVAMARPGDPGGMLSLAIPQGTVVPEGAVYLVAHTLYGGIHNLAKCVQIPIVNRVD
jgi:hypothetical protein